MSDETISKKYKLIAKDKEQAKREGVISRGASDAREIMMTGRYEMVHGSIETKPPVDVLDGTPVIPDAAPNTPEDPEAKAKRVKSMNTAAIEEFLEKEDMDVDLEGLNLKLKRQAVIDALGEGDEEDE